MWGLAISSLRRRLLVTSFHHVITNTRSQIAQSFSIEPEKWIQNRTHSNLFRADDAKVRNENNRRECEEGVTIQGVQLSRLETMTRREIAEHYGRAQFNKLIRNGPDELLEILDTIDPLEDEDGHMHIQQLFYVAEHIGAVNVMIACLTKLESFAHATLTQTSRFQFINLYMTLYDVMKHQGQYIWMLDIYYDAQKRLRRKLAAWRRTPQRQSQPELPEIFYRFAILGLFAEGNVTGVDQLIREMALRSETRSFLLKTEMSTQLVLGYAKAGEEGKAMKIFNQVFSDGQAIKPLHDADVNRLTIALAWLGKPERAISFMEQSNVPPSYGTFIELLQVYRTKNAKHAARLLIDKRHDFGFEIDTHGYNEMMDCLIMCGIPDRIQEMLDEMHARGLKRSSRTRRIILQNGEYIRETRNLRSMQWRKWNGRKRKAKGQVGVEDN